eukprot:5696993-Amphidinium_carterae.2
MECRRGGYRFVASNKAPKRLDELRLHAVQQMWHLHRCMTSKTCKLLGRGTRVVDVTTKNFSRCHKLRTTSLSAPRSVLCRAVSTHQSFTIWAIQTSCVPILLTNVLQEAFHHLSNRSVRLLPTLQQTSL